MNHTEAINELIEFISTDLDVYWNPSTGEHSKKVIAEVIVEYADELISLLKRDGYGS